MKLLNYTPRYIVFFDDNQVPYHRLESVGMARLDVEVSPFKKELVSGKPIHITTNEVVGVTGLPQWRKKVFYIVSKIVAQAHPDRKDLYFVNEKVYKNGICIGCKSICKL